MKKTILLLILLISGQLISFGANFHSLEVPSELVNISTTHPKSQTEKIETIYNKQIPCDIKFENDLDPYEQQDNYSYGMSPYPLIRTVMNLYAQKTTIPPGYYLLTPRKINGRTYMLFKQTGKVLFIVPVFEDKQIDSDKEYPQPKDPYESAPLGLRSAWKFLGVISGRRTPIVKTPQNKIDTFAYDDQFYGINVYYKDRIYKTVYKVKLYE